MLRVEFKVQSQAQRQKADTEGQKGVRINVSTEYTESRSAREEARKQVDCEWSSPVETRNVGAKIVFSYAESGLSGDIGDENG